MLNPQAVFSLTVIVLAAVYCGTILLFVAGLFRLRERCGDVSREISIVVAARNEEEAIGACLSALVEQSYPKERYEIIVVDDRSTDRTFEIARSYELECPNVHVLRVGDRRKYACPKKNALDLGIRASRGEILLLTDADCRPGPMWAAAMVGCFEEDVGLVAGYSPVEGGDTLFGRLLSLESLATAVLSAGSVGTGFPLACTGRNLAYRRVVFDAVAGFERIGHILSGDDVLLMRRIATRTAWRTAYAISPESFVETGTAPRGRVLFRQKVRHTAKARYYSARILTLAGAIYLFHLLLPLTVLLAFSGFLGPVVPCIALCAKICMDLLALLRGARLFRRTRLLRYFPIFEFLYVPYVILFSALGYFMRIRWKEDEP